MKTVAVKCDCKRFLHRTYYLYRYDRCKNRNFSVKLSGYIAQYWIIIFSCAFFHPQPHCSRCLVKTVEKRSAPRGPHTRPLRGRGDPQKCPYR